MAEEYEKAKSEDSLRNRQRRSPLTIKRTLSAVRAFQRALDGNPRLDSIKASTVERFIRKCQKQGRKPGGINVELRHLKALFNWAMRRELILRNPFLAVDMFKTELKGPRPLTPDELERLFLVCPKGSRWYPFIMTYLLTGARLSEILKPKLAWENIDFEHETLTLPHRKGGKSSVIPMDSVLLSIFRELRNNPFKKEHTNLIEDQLYPFPLNHSYVSHKIKELLNRAGIDATAHDLRDSFVSHLIYLGYSIEDVSKMAGHSSIRVTEAHYYGQIEERRRQMVSDLGRHFTNRASKTGTQNRDKTRPTVPFLDLFNILEDDSNNPSMPDDKEGFPTVARGGIEPPTHGFSDHLGLVDKQKKSMENVAVI